MNITIRLTKVEYEMLEELLKKDKRYKKGLEVKVRADSPRTTKEVEVQFSDFYPPPWERIHIQIFLKVHSGRQVLLRRTLMQ